MNTSNITNYKQKDFTELLGVSVRTLQRWETGESFKANRTPTDRHDYTYDSYARVSARNQKDGLSMRNYHHKKNLYRILFQFFICSLAGCMNFVSVKSK